MEFNKHKITLAVLVMLTLHTFAQKVNWVSIEEAVRLNEKEPRNILIDVYTDWCGYCKKMDRETYENKVIVGLINKNFYAVKFNAEQRDSVVFKGKTFGFINQGRRGVHEFAAALLKGKMSYPSTVFLDKKQGIIDRVPGYLRPDFMEQVLGFIGEDRYKDTNFENYQKNHTSQL